MLAQRCHIITTVNSVDKREEYKSLLHTVVGQEGLWRSGPLQKCPIEEARLGCWADIVPGGSCAAQSYCGCDD